MRGDCDFANSALHLDPECRGLALSRDEAELSVEEIYAAAQKTGFEIATSSASYTSRIVEAESEFRLRWRERPQNAGECLLTCRVTFISKQ